MEREGGVATSGGGEDAKSARQDVSGRQGRKVGINVAECSFSKFQPRGSAISDSGRALLYRMGTGVLGQKGGSPVALACPNGDSFPGWIDAEGDLMSALDGLAFANTLYSYPEDGSALRLWENRGGGWVEIPGFADIRVPLPPGGRASEAIYSAFSDGPISDYSARLLKYFGLGIADRESIVRLRIGDSVGSGVVDSSGKVRVTDETHWTEQFE